MKTRPSYVSPEEWKRRQRELMPVDYSTRIKIGAQEVAIRRPDLTFPEAASVATGSILVWTAHRLANEINVGEHGLEHRAQLEWADKQLDRVQNNARYRSATERR